MSWRLPDEPILTGRTPDARPLSVEIASGVGEELGGEGPEPLCLVRVESVGSDAAPYAGCERNGFLTVLEIGAAYPSASGEAASSTEVAAPWGMSLTLTPVSPV